MLCNQKTTFYVFAIIIRRLYGFGCNFYISTPLHGSLYSKKYEEKFRVGNTPNEDIVVT